MILLLSGAQPRTVFAPINVCLDVCSESGAEEKIDEDIASSSHMILLLSGAQPKNSVSPDPTSTTQTGQEKNKLTNTDAYNENLLRNCANGPKGKGLNRAVLRTRGML